MGRIAIYPGYQINFVGHPFEFSERFLRTLKDASHRQANGPYLWVPGLTQDQQKKMLLKWCEDMGFSTERVRDLAYKPFTREGMAKHFITCGYTESDYQIHFIVHGIKPDALPDGTLRIGEAIMEIPYKPVLEIESESDLWEKVVKNVPDIRGDS